MSFSIERCETHISFLYLYLDSNCEIVSEEKYWYNRNVPIICPLLSGYGTRGSGHIIRNAWIRGKKMSQQPEFKKSGRGWDRMMQEASVSASRLSWTITPPREGLTASISPTHSLFPVESFSLPIFLWSCSHHTGRYLFFANKYLKKWLGQ